MDDEIDHPDPEVPERATRRRFAPEYKARILAEYERLADGEKGALLRREGLYSSLISEWRKQAARGAAEGLAKPIRRAGHGLFVAQSFKWGMAMYATAKGCARPRDKISVPKSVGSAVSQQSGG